MGLKRISLLYSSNQLHCFVGLLMHLSNIIRILVAYWIVTKIWVWLNGLHERAMYTVITFHVDNPFLSLRPQLEKCICLCPMKPIPITPIGHAGKIQFSIIPLDLCTVFPILHNANSWQSPSFTFFDHSCYYYQVTWQMKTKCLFEQPIILKCTLDTRNQIQHIQYTIRNKCMSI